MKPSFFYCISIFVDFWNITKGRHFDCSMNIFTDCMFSFLVLCSLEFILKTKTKCKNSLLNKTKSIILELHVILNFKKTKRIFLVDILNNKVIHFISLPIKAPFFTVKSITTFIPSKHNFLKMNRINRWHNLFKTFLCLLLH